MVTLKQIRTKLIREEQANTYDLKLSAAHYVFRSVSFCQLDYAPKLW